MSHRSEPTIIEHLADWVRSIRAEDVPDAAIAQAKLLLLDAIGCGFAALNDRVAQAVIETVAPAGGQGGCTIFGSGRKSSLPNAVLANGTLVRVLDLNDYVVSADGDLGGHPSDNIPVALAAGELAGRRGRDVLASIVVGYELYARVREPLDRRAWDGVTASGVAASAMTGSLLGLERDRLAHAMALGAAMTATPRVVRSGHISAAKSIANALVAQSGAQAALLASNGVTGPLSVIEHPGGLRAVFVEGADFSELSAPLPANSYIMQAHVKTYPCVGTAQSSVAAGIQLHRLLAGKTDDIASIKVSMADYPTVRAHQGSPERSDPRSREAADHSMPFLVAVAVIDGKLGPQQFAGERWNDPAVRRLMARLQFGTDPDWRKRAPASYPCRLEAVTETGQEYRVEVPFPPGFSRGGLEAKVVLDKFRRSTEQVLSQPAGDKIVEAAMTFDQSPSCRVLLDRVGTTPNPAG